MSINFFDLQARQSIRTQFSGVSLLLFLQGMRICSGVTLAKLDLIPSKTETSKFSLRIISSGGFSFFLIAKFY